MFNFNPNYFCISTLLWFKYGFILGDLAMSIVNGFGLILALYSALIYHQHTIHRKSCQIFSIIGLAGVLFWFMAVSDGWIKLDGIGFSAMTTSVCMYASPLTAVFGILKHHFSAEAPKTVLLNRKKISRWVPREGISLGMILVTLAVSSSWLAYGLVIGDKFVAIPNGLGVFMCLIQYGVWSISYPVASSSNGAIPLDGPIYGIANSNSSSRAESRNGLLRYFKQDHHSATPNQDPLMAARPNTVAPIIEMKQF